MKKNGVVKGSNSSGEIKFRGAEQITGEPDMVELKKLSPQSDVPNFFSGSLMSPSIVSALLVLATAVSFYQVKSSGIASTSSKDENKNYVLGLSIAGIALVGNAAVGALRKILSQHNVGSAQQVGLATMIQGVASIAYCIYSGQLDVGPHFVQKLPASDFWIAAISSSALGAVVKTLETKAFAESDISLCAPFLAFDPVMQFVVGVAIMPITCSLLQIGCDESKSSYPPYHVLSVASIAYGAFLLGFSGKSSKGSSKVKYLGPLPMGSWYILLNCVIYGFTSRMDKVAIKSAGKTLYYAYGRILMASTTLGGSLMSGGMTSKELRKVRISSIRFEHLDWTICIRMLIRFILRGPLVIAVFFSCAVCEAQRASPAPGNLRSRCSVHAVSLPGDGSVRICSCLCTFPLFPF
jgi:hypothetical protein